MGIRKLYDFRCVCDCGFCRNYMDFKFPGPDINYEQLKRKDSPLFKNGFHFVKCSYYDGGVQDHIFCPHCFKKYFTIQNAHYTFNDLVLNFGAVAWRNDRIGDHITLNTGLKNSLLYIVPETGVLYQQYSGTVTNIQPKIIGHFASLTKLKKAIDEIIKQETTN